MDGEGENEFDWTIIYLFLVVWFKIIIVSLALGERQVWDLLFAGMAALIFGMKALLGYWVYRDASAREFQLRVLGR